MSRVLLKRSLGFGDRSPPDAALQVYEWMARDLRLLVSLPLDPFDDSKARRLILAARTIRRVVMEAIIRADMVVWRMRAMDALCRRVQCLRQPLDFRFQGIYVGHGHGCL